MTLSSRLARGIALLASAVLTCLIVLSTDAIMVAAATPQPLLPAQALLA